MCIFLLQIIIHIQVVTETEEVGWVMKALLVHRVTFFMGK